MATTKIIDVIKRCETVLQDTTSTRWPKQELLDWFNDAQLAIVSRRPDTHIKNIPFTCASGTKQSIPADGLRLMKVVRNSNGKAVRKIEQRVLDDQVPDWHVPAESVVVDHYIYNDFDPKTFYLYPAPMSGIEVDIIYSVAPAAVVINDFSGDATTITLDDSYLNPILDWMLYRAYSKDNDYTANTNRAQMHLEAFRMGIGEKTQADQVSAQLTAQTAPMGG
ncbi:DUF6682 family protein [Photobacterium halotolerans]|uniref:phage adaptor protein n=1 Tax=Photobacterium halotolerans TaxID=265726 RepID=UPI0005608FD2|nr:DUF6682 family protein [Photobacterium halotolerans]